MFSIWNKSKSKPVLSVPHHEADSSEILGAKVTGVGKKNGEIDVIYVETEGKKYMITGDNLTITSFVPG
jgi:hypothetical protein